MVSGGAEQQMLGPCGLIFWSLTDFLAWGPPQVSQEVPESTSPSAEDFPGASLHHFSYCPVKPETVRETTQGPGHRDHFCNQPNYGINTDSDSHWRGHMEIKAQTVFTGK